jgi:hypothetical protein
VPAPCLQELLATILNQPIQPPCVAMSGQSVFDMMEDLLATDITIEQVDTRTEPSTTGCIVKIGGNHPVSKETADYGAKVNVAMEDSNEDDDEVLLLGN